MLSTGSRRTRAASSAVSSVRGPPGAPIRPILSTSASLVLRNRAPFPIAAVARNLAIPRELQQMGVHGVGRLGNQLRVEARVDVGHQLIDRRLVRRRDGAQHLRFTVESVRDVLVDDLLRRLDQVTVAGRQRPQRYRLFPYTTLFRSRGRRTTTS